MARPRKNLFYESPKRIQPLSGQEWLETYDSNCQKVVDYLVLNGVGNTIYYSTVNCLEKLRIFLLQNNTPYSFREANQWFETTGPHPKGYQTALSRLQDIFEYGKIQPINAFPVSLPYYSCLQGLWKEEIDAYLATLDHCGSSLTQIRNCVSRFLYRIQASGIRHPSELSFDLLSLYLESDAHKSHNAEAKYTYAISDILIFMASKGLCTQGLGWYPYFKMHGKVLRMQNLSESQIGRIEAFRSESLQFPSEEFAKLIPDFMERYHSTGYNRSACSTARYTLYNLLLFLEMHGLGYHPEIAAVWMEYEKTFYKDSDRKQIRRILDLFALYTKEGDVVPQAVFLKKPLLCDALPDWCKDELGAFLGQKEKEGWETSTLCMYRSAVTRFCQFLVDKGILSFMEISPRLIKDFNQTDHHLTVEGKNAYNGRIRKFLQFLERKGSLPYGLHQALCCMVAVKENIVVILSDDEKDQIARKHAAAASPMELRNRAILLLGMKMGLRASDIVNIKLSDINWKCQSIRVLQKKTQHEVELPMPVGVGNAIYLYIKHGRPQTNCPSVFVKTRIPFDSLHRGICLQALKSTLPERHCPGSGFHVTRKTFATDQLCHNVGKNSIADMLGHRDTGTLSYYLNLDSQRMRMCPLSLADTGLKMEGQRYD